MAEEKEKKERKIKVYKPQPGLQEKVVASNIDVVFCGGSMSSGKALLLDAKVVTPFGLRRYGDLKVGDIISNPDTGGQERVIQLHPVAQYPFYKISFSDGTSVECSEGHLWKIRKSGNFTKRKTADGVRDDWRIWDAKMIYEWMQNKKSGMYKNNRITIPLTQPVQFTRPITPTPPRPIHPYLLGALLGDGCVSTSAINNGCVYFTTPDKEVMDRFREFYDVPRGAPKKGTTALAYQIHDKRLLDAIKVLHLDGHTAKDKFIPGTYKHSTIEERKQLLQGLMDTDGYVDTDGCLEYTTISRQLAEDVMFVVRSLGGRASVRSKISTFIYEGEKKKGQLAYTIAIATPFNHELVSLPKKKNRVTGYGRLYLEKYITDIEYLGMKEGRCITVDNPSGLYITDDFTVTHNSFGLILSMAEPIQDPNFRAVFLRRNLNETKVAGGLFEDTKKVFASYIRSAKESDNPRITFKSGAFIDYTHISDETPANLLERIRGWQYPCIVMDEGTSFAWTTFRLLFSRNRGTSKWTNKFRVSCNPKKSSWIRTFIKDYIGPDGFIRPDWDGKVRYFYIKGKRVEDVVWGDTKEEVYEQCRYEIDEALDKFQKKGLDIDYRSLIKSFTFYLGSTAENKAMVGNDATYLGSVAAMGEAEARANLLGNWNVDEEEDDEAPIKAHEARAVFSADAQANNDKWITVDLADTGTDNTLILVWNGFHIIDYKILMKSTPRINAEAIAAMADKHGIGDSHIIYDAVRAAYMIDYLPQAIGYVSYRAPLGVYGRMADNLKTECYLRLVNMIVNQRISFDESVSHCCYRHLNLQPITFQTEFEEECSVVRFLEVGSGKKRLMNKKEMNAKLGKHRSMDLLDSCAMRMLPVLGYEYGDELAKTAVEVKKLNMNPGLTVNVYDDATWA